MSELFILGLKVCESWSTSRSASRGVSLSCSLTLSPSQTAPPVVRQALPDIECQLWLPGSADSDMLATSQGRSSLLHLLQRQAHEVLEQVPKNGCVHAHLHDALHAAAHQLVLKLLKDDCTHGVVVLRQQMVIHAACMHPHRYHALPSM